MKEHINGADIASLQSNNDYSQDGFDLPAV